MQLLASSPRIAFDRRFPYEVRHLAYLIRAAQVISTAAGPSEELPFPWSQRQLADSALNHLGPLPGRSALFDPARRRRAVSEALFRIFSEELAENAPGSTHYAEKVASGDLVEHARTLTRAKVIYGVRDPRDQLISIMRFNEKRGSLKFGWRAGDDQLSFAKRLCRQSRRYLDAALSAAKASERDALLVRYEDIVSRRAHTIERLSDWLGVELTDSVVREQQDHLAARHATSLSARQSVGRWRDELSPEVKDLFERELGPSLQAMGWQ